MTKLKVALETFQMLSPRRTITTTSKKITKRKQAKISQTMKNLSQLTKSFFKLVDEKRMCQ